MGAYQAETGRKELELELELDHHPFQREEEACAPSAVRGS